MAFCLGGLQCSKAPLTTKDFFLLPSLLFFFPRHQFQSTPNPVISQSTEAPFPPPLLQTSLKCVFIPLVNYRISPTTTGDQLSRNSHLTKKEKQDPFSTVFLLTTPPSVFHSILIVFVKLCFLGRNPLLQGLSIIFSF